MGKVERRWDGIYTSKAAIIPTIETVRSRETTSAGPATDSTCWGLGRTDSVGAGYVC